MAKGNSQRKLEWINRLNRIERGRREFDAEVMRRIEERIAEAGERIEALTRPPETGWRNAGAGDCFRINMSNVFSPLSVLDTKREFMAKYVVVLRNPLDTNEPRLPIVIADSFKPGPLHESLLEFDTHLYLASGEENPADQFMRRASLIDCSKEYNVPRGLFENRSPKSKHELFQGTMCVEVMRQIAIAISYRSGLDRFYDLDGIETLRLP